MSYPADRYDDRVSLIAPPRRGKAGFIHGSRGKASLRATVVLACVALAIGLWGGSASGADTTASAAEAALARATALRMKSERRLSDAKQHLSKVEAELARLGEVDEQLTRDLASAGEALREFAIAAYIDGGQSDAYRSMLSIKQAQALAWQSNLSAGQATSVDHVMDRYERLRAANTPQRRKAAAALEQATVAVTEASNDAIQAAAFERDAEAHLLDVRNAQRVARQKATEASVAANASSQPKTSTSDSSPDQKANPVTTRSESGGARGNPTAGESATLARIRRCESRGNYSIVSSSGRYRGAYQFDYRTWAGMGGSGDPAAASPAEQDYRALLLLRLRGTRPWPVCGR